MATYLHPGVYVEEIPSGSKPIEGVATSVAAFIGYTTKGPLGEPVRITKYDDYKDQFGGVRDMEKDAKGDPMGMSVLAFFQNGGTTTYIVRITQNWMDDTDRTANHEPMDAVKAVGYMDHPDPAEINHALKFTAVNEGTWANGVVATFTPPKGAAPDAPLTPPYTLVIGRKNQKNEVVPRETFSGLSLDENDAQFIGNVVNGFSELVEVELIPVGEVPTTEVLPGEERLFQGASRSDDLSSLTLPIDLTAESPANRTLSIQLDDKPAADFVIDPESHPHLEDLAAAIQATVRGRASTQPRSGFTCAVANNRLVLVSGSRTPDSAVIVNDSPLAATLKLGTAHGGAEIKGSDAARGAWISTTGSALSEATLGDGQNGSDPTTADYEDVF